MDGHASQIGANRVAECAVDVARGAVLLEHGKTVRRIAWMLRDWHPLIHQSLTIRRDQGPPETSSIPSRVTQSISSGDSELPDVGPTSDR